MTNNSTHMSSTPKLSTQLDEWNYRRAERLAILCPEGNPTADQIRTSEAEADEAIRRLNDPDEQRGQKTLL